MRTSLSVVLVSFRVNLTQVRVIWREENPLRKCPVRLANGEA